MLLALPAHSTMICLLWQGLAILLRWVVVLRGEGLHGCFVGPLSGLRRVARSRE